MIELGLTEDQFWNMTPALYFALCYQKQKQTKRHDLRFGLILELVGRALNVKRRALEWFGWPEEQISRRATAAERVAVIQNLKQKKAELSNG